MYNLCTEGECTYIRKSTSACVITNMLHFLALKSTQNSLLVYQLLYIVMGTCCDCGSIFCHCYDVSSLYFVIMTFIRIMVVIVVLVLLNYNGSKIIFNRLTMIK